MELVKSEFSEVLMEINKVELDPKVETFIESEQEKYETSNGITCNYTPFCFVAKHGDEIMASDRAKAVTTLSRWCTAN